MKEKLFRSSHAIGLAARIIVSVFIIALIIWKYDDLQNIDIRALVDSSSSVFAAVGTIWGVYLLKSITLVLPASLIYIAVGMCFPAHWAILINAVGIIIEVSASYLFGIIMGGPYVKNKLEKTKYGEKILSLQEKNKLSAIFVIRVLPVFPIDIVSLLLGAVRMKFLHYFLVSLGGILPRVILFTILGDGIYDYFPMQKIVLAAAILIPVALVAWVIKYAVKMSKAEDNYGKSPYEPIMESRRYVIFDTDIGPDCDDAGAMAVLFEMAKKYDVKILGFANCTSNPYGNGAIRAIAEHYGYEDIKIGQHKGYEILKDGDKYNKPVTKKYCKYENSAIHAASATEFYESVLKKAEDDSVTVISVGPLTNLAQMLNEQPELFNKKVNSIVAMAGKFPKGKEFNIECDPSAAATVFEKFKNIIVCSGFEIGEKIKTGFAKEHEDNPVFDCYKYFLGKKELPLMRESWDLTAVHYAFEGEGEYYSLSKPVKITVEENGHVSVSANKYSKRYYLIRKAEGDKTAEYLNGILERENIDNNGE
ncbi:MAG: nucleoside hydrolase [Clostridia bacterium]|nr:nucleoside hydrolase [Clostridia bacterium]